MRRQLFEAAPYVGIAYVSRGDALEGCDCWGLVRLVYRQEFGIELPALCYADAEALDQVAAVVEREQARPVWEYSTEPAPGDVVLFRMAGLPTHVGIVLALGRFLHCLHGRAACIERLDALIWAHRIVGYYRWMG